MKPLSRPTDNARDVFLTCVRRVRDKDLRSLLLSIASDVEQADNEFEVAGQQKAFHLLEAHESVRGVVSAGQMQAVYTGRMAKKRASGRKVYDRIKAAPHNERCPLCGQRTVSTLDHYLPKTRYPLLVVVPANLIPACAECNKVKGDAVPSQPEEQTLHPYYDDISQETWLHAEVVPVSPPALKFMIRPPNDCDSIMYDRVLLHFELFQLASLYASHAAEELSNIRYYIEHLFSQGGTELVQTHLREMATSCRETSFNSWQTALYQALSTSEWYCSGGFR